MFTLHVFYIEFLSRYLWAPYKGANNSSLVSKFTLGKIQACLYRGIPDDKGSLTNLQSSFLGVPKSTIITMSGLETSIMGKISRQIHLVSWILDLSAQSTISEFAIWDREMFLRSITNVIYGRIFRIHINESVQFQAKDLIWSFMYSISTLTFLDCESVCNDTA